MRNPGVLGRSPIFATTHLVPGPPDASIIPVSGPSRRWQSGMLRIWQLIQWIGSVGKIYSNPWFQANADGTGAHAAGCHHHVIARR